MCVTSEPDVLTTGSCCPIMPVPRHSQVPSACLSLIVILDTGRANAINPHLTGGETEAQRKAVTCPRSHCE